MDAGLRIQHVRLAAPDAGGKPSGLDIVIQYSKTSRTPAQISICSRVDALCPDSSGRVRSLPPVPPRATSSDRRR